MKLIAHMEPSQLRLGYLCCLSLVAGRQLDTHQGLVDRLGRFLFREIDSHDPEWRDYMDRVDEIELRRLRTPQDEKTAALRELFRTTEPELERYQLQALWLAQRDLPSHLGLLAEKNAKRILEMGRSFGILTTGYALSEKGVFLQSFLQRNLSGVQDGKPSANPFMVNRFRVLQLLFFYTLLSVDIPTPFILDEFTAVPEGDPSNSPQLLPRAAMKLLSAVETYSDISTIDSLRLCRDFAKRLETKAVAKNQAQPRYHHLFELGLLGRLETGQRAGGAAPYVATEECKRASSVLQPLRENPGEQEELIDRHFFQWAAQIYSATAAKCESDLHRLYYFACGFPYLEREIGFTPGRTVAIAGSLLALEDGWIIEISDMFDTLRRMAAGPWRSHLEYSGGSRLDQEFLIKVKPELIPALRREIPDARNLS